MCLEKRKTVITSKESISHKRKANIKSQLGYCSLVWMFHSRSLNNKINFLHERALKVH